MHQLCRGHVLCRCGRHCGLHLCRLWGRQVCSSRRFHLRRLWLRLHLFLHFLLIHIFYRLHKLRGWQVLSRRQFDSLQQLFR